MDEAELSRNTLIKESRSSALPREDSSMLMTKIKTKTNESGCTRARRITLPLLFAQGNTIMELNQWQGPLLWKKRTGNESSLFHLCGMLLGKLVSLQQNLEY